MITPTISIRVLDNGIYDKTFAQIQLKRIDEEEELFVKYGDLKSFYPLSVMMRENQIYLSAAMVGLFADIKIPINQWIDGLKRLGSKQKLSDWQFIIKKLEKVA